VAVETPVTPTWSVRQRVVLTALLATGLLLIVLGFRAGQTGDKAVSITDPAIERLIPTPGSLVLRQSEVGIDLAAGYTGTLDIDGIDLPTYEIGQTDTPQSFDKNLDARYDPGQGTVLFLPREGAQIAAFSPGRHTITAKYWRVADGAQSAKTFTWSFSVS
jgi:hypothetical protein